MLSDTIHARLSFRRKPRGGHRLVLESSGVRKGLLAYSFGLAGGSPAASHFLLLRQKKVTKEKATQVRRPPSGGSLRCSQTKGGSGTRGSVEALAQTVQGGARRSDILADGPPPSLRCSTTLMGTPTA